LLYSYGFKKWIWFQDYIASRPSILPLVNRVDGEVPKSAWSDEKIAAVFMMHEPHNWMEGLQLLCDVLLSDGMLTNEGYTRAPEQVVELFIANGDFSYSASFNQPRITAGAFTMCLATLYKQYSGRELRRTVYGKPGLEYHQYAETMLRQASILPGSTKDEIATIYMIGDNPKSDIQGANASGDHWHSVLVRTGLFKGDNDPTHPAKHVSDTVYHAIQYILQREGLTEGNTAQ
jgi:HAD superfamily hydrolase (TIGR01456 family)